MLCTQCAAGNSFLRKTPKAIRLRLGSRLKLSSACFEQNRSAIAHHELTRLEESPEELEPQASGSRRGRPPGRGTAVDLVGQPDGPVPERLTALLRKKIAAILGWSILVLA